MVTFAFIAPALARQTLIETKIGAGAQIFLLTC
jgi:hypothetical protein